MRLAILLAAVEVIGALLSSRGTDQPALSGLGAGLLLLQTLPLVFRRRFPLATWAVTVGATVAYGVAEMPDIFVYLGPLVALYTVVASCPRTTSWVVVGLTFALIPVAAWLAGDFAPSDYYAALLAPALATALGELQRTRAAYLAEVEARLAQVSRERDEQAASSASVDGQTVSGFDAISSTARQALRELRRLLGVLRDANEQTPTAPQPHLADVPALMQHVRQAGLQVELLVEGNRRELPPGVDLSAYRIIQEALTNTLRHASGTRVSVRIRYGEDALQLSVRDDGRSASSPAQVPRGHGLVGIRERVALFGGEVRMGTALTAGSRSAPACPSGPETAHDHSSGGSRRPAGRTRRIPDHSQRATRHRRRR